MSQIDLTTKIKETMKEKGITQQELAAKIKITQPTLSAKLSRNNFTLKEIDKIFSALGYDADIVLLGQKNEPLLKVIHWNINNKYVDNTPLITLIEILKSDADVVVLTEYYKTNNYLEIKEALEYWGYKVFLDPRARKAKIRQVCIAIKKDMLVSYEEPEILDDNENDLFGNKNLDNQMPNYLSIKTVMKDRKGNKFPVVFIGTRIRNAYFRDKNEKRYISACHEGEQKFRYSQFTNLIEQIKRLKALNNNNINMIIIGDFNIGANGYNKSPWSYEKNFKKTLEEDIDFTVKTPDGDNYSPIVWEEDVKAKPYAHKFKLDHLLLSKNMQKYAVKVKYCHKKEWKEWKNRDNYPDHAILSCDFYEL